ncbi:E3 ubiquitin-protein ligase TRIM35 isoform X2 [Dunckerocampus dactyliophorus]|uniref:E3 ubiquitin-protein ligase TRIM35 isoform X2 n=1 Tax=Dunckerocampus dactyliophorus TaxID=161453 RepID=UPI002407283D|nr:E3 ubiquitin-protein ligase TRIM35 isoform X2 [Dunckerocampus dactyliophorus]
MAEKTSRADQENKLEQEQNLRYFDDQAFETTARRESTNLDLTEEEETSPQTEEETECPGCQSVGVVTLPCSHKLCLRCIELSQQEMGHEGCTICYGSQLMDSVLHSLLGALFQGQPRRYGVTPQAEAAILRTAAEESKTYGENGNLEKEQQCVKHGEPFSEFCLDKGDLLCQKCQMNDQEQHQCCSIQEAVLVCKRQMRSTIRAIQEQLETITTIKQNWEDTATHIMTQSITTTQILREEFEKMHQHLRDEEAALMSELKREEEEKIQQVEHKINKLSNDIRNLTTGIRELEEFMESENIFFLKNYRSASQRTPYRVDEYKDEFGALIDVPKYQSCIQHHVWEKMLRIIHYFPVTLDPNTGSSCLVVSPDLSSVLVCDEQPLPDNPERFVNPQGVLGSAGFSSGSHHWEVEVGENSQWSLGVASESVNRKDWSGLDENPVESSGGLWTVSLSSGVREAQTSLFPSTVLHPALPSTS